MRTLEARRRSEGAVVPDPAEPTPGLRAATRLPSGERLVIRDVTAADETALGRLFASLSEEDRYRRFFSCFHPDDRFLRRLVTVGERGGAALVAEITAAGAATPRVVAEGEFVLLPNGNGELSMVVAAPFRGWLAPFLLDVLVEVAAGMGVPNLEADVLSQNGPMLAVLRHRGMAVIPRDDWSIVRVCIGTAGPGPTWPPRSSGRRVLVEVPGGRWTDAQGDDDLVVLACSGPSPSCRCPLLDGERCRLVEGADEVVVVPRAGDEAWSALLDAHRSRRGAGGVHEVARGTALPGVLASLRRRGTGGRGDDD